jgi:hypothetical protein
MVAAHAWDLLGATRAGMKTPTSRASKAWPAMLEEPDWNTPDLAGLASLL